MLGKLISNQSATPAASHTITESRSLPISIKSSPAKSIPEHSKPSTSSTPAFEGGTALSAHSTSASELLDRVVQVDGSQFAERSPDMAAALTSLRSIVARQNVQSVADEIRLPNQKNDPVHPASLILPPIEAALEMLRKPRGEWATILRSCWLPYVSASRHWTLDRVFVSKCSCHRTSSVRCLPVSSLSCGRWKAFSCSIP